MSSDSQNRRQFLHKSAAAAAAGLTAPYWFSAERILAADNQSKNDRPLVGCIGTGDRWKGLFKGVLPHGDIVAVADVDRTHAETGKELSGGKADIYEDYRKLLDRKDIDVVTIVTPDHWHTKIAIDAMKAGKDVYCEKPPVGASPIAQVALVTLPMRPSRIIAIAVKNRRLISVRCCVPT